jgi:hypothetical protein
VRDQVSHPYKTTGRIVRTHKTICHLHVCYDPIFCFLQTDRLSIISGFHRGVRSSFFWDVTHCRLVVSYRRFGKTYQSHLQG